MSDYYERYVLPFRTKNPDYNKTWAKGYRKRKRLERMMSRGKCPYCEFLLNAEWHQKYPCKSYEVHIYAIRASVGTFGVACV
jgi:hypothetical protein